MTCSTRRPYFTLIPASFLLCALATGPVAADQHGLSQSSIDHARALRDSAMAGSGAYGIVESLTTEVGPRLAGTDAEARARGLGPGNHAGDRS